MKFGDLLQSTGETTTSVMVGDLIQPSYSFFFPMHLSDAVGMQKQQMLITVLVDRINSVSPACAKVHPMG